jgi:methyl-accepting chemotaxis protein
MNDLAPSKGGRFRSISTKLMALQSLAFVVMIAISVSGYMGINTILARMNSVYNDRVIPIDQIKHVSDAYLYELRVTSNAYVNGNLSAREAIAELDSHAKVVVDKWNAYMATFLTEEEKKLIAEVDAAFPAARDIKSRIQTLVTANNLEAVRLILPEIDVATRPLQVALDDLIDYQISEADRMTVEATGLGTTLVWSILAASLVAIGVSLSASIIFTRRIKRALVAAVDMTNAVADGDLSVHADRKSNDEIGQVVDGLNVMIDRLRTVVGEVAVASGNVSSGAEQMASTAEATEPWGNRASLVDGRSIRGDGADGRQRKAVSAECTRHRNNRPQIRHRCPRKRGSSGQGGRSDANDCRKDHGRAGNRSADRPSCTERSCGSGKSW